MQCPLKQETREFSPYCKISCVKFRYQYYSVHFDMQRYIAQKIASLVFQAIQN